jgi:mannose-6-phosphate isomerase-like protein (cupin superfamily)
MMQTTLDDGHGKRLTFLESTPQRLRFDEVSKGHTQPVQPHIHLKQTERFEIKSGTLALRLGKKEQILKAGESVIVPAGIPHTYWNPYDQEVHVHIELEPALNYQHFFESVYGLTREGLLPSPHPLLGALLLNEYKLYVQGLPILFQKITFGILASVARTLGYKVWKPDYRALDSLATSDSTLVLELT